MKVYQLENTTLWNTKTKAVACPEKGWPLLLSVSANLSACHFLELEFDGGRNVFNVILTRLLLLFTGRIKRTVKR